MAAVISRVLFFPHLSLISSKGQFAIWLLFFMCLLFATGAKADPREMSAEKLQEGIIAFDAKMYGYSKESFERAIELDRSNFEAILYLAKVLNFLEEYTEAERQASSLVSSFYPNREFKIEALQLLGDIYNRREQAWQALSYIYAASELSTNVSLRHLVDEQIGRLNLNELQFPDFVVGSNMVLTSKTLSYQDGMFEDLETRSRFEVVPYAIRSLNTRYVVMAGFDDRLRFSKLLLLKIEGNLKPQLEEVTIQSRRRGGFQGTRDLYLKIMDWNFDGYPDLVVRVTQQSAGAKQAFLLYNPSNGKFDYNEELSALDDPILDRAGKAVLEESCTQGRGAVCTRMRYKLFAGNYALAQFEKNTCPSATSCMYTTAEIEVASLRTSEYMYLVNTIETSFETLRSRFQASASGHTVITRRVLKSYYTPNYDVTSRDKEIMMLDLDGSWEFPASYVKEWINNYFSKQPLDGQLGRPILPNSRQVID